MIVSIKKKEKECLEKACALFGLKLITYTMENNPELVKAEITEPAGQELIPKDAWLLGRSVAWEIVDANLM